MKALYLIIPTLIAVLISCNTVKKENKTLLNHKEGNYYRTSDSFYTDILGTWVSEINDSIFKIKFENTKVLYKGKADNGEDLYADRLSGYYCYTSKQDKCEINYSIRSLHLDSDIKKLSIDKKPVFSFTDNITNKLGILFFDIQDKNNAKWVLKGTGLRISIKGRKTFTEFTAPYKMVFKKQ